MGIGLYCKYVISHHLSFQLQANVPVHSQKLCCTHAFGLSVFHKDAVDSWIACWQWL